MENFAKNPARKLEEFMGKIVRTIQGRLAAFNAQSDLAADLRQLLRSLDGKRDQQDFENMLADRGDMPVQLLQLMAMGLVQEASDSRGNETNHSSRSTAYLPTLPAALTPLCATEISPRLATERHDKAMPQPSAQLLAQCKADMEIFLLMHAPLVAVELIRDIENLSNLAQLKASLSAYEQIIQSTGHLGWTHLAQLRELLAHDTSND